MSTNNFDDNMRDGNDLPDDGVEPENEAHTDDVTAERADPAYERLQKADPAAHAEPDTAELRESVRGRLSSSASSSMTSSSLGQHRPAAKWLKVAAASAAVLAIGFGGYAIGNSGSTTDQAATTVVTTVEDFAVDPGEPVVGGDGIASAGIGEASPPTPALGVPNAEVPASGGAVAQDDKMRSSLYAGRTVFTDGGLSTEEGNAPSWYLDPAQVVSVEAVQRLAAAMGVVGDPRQEYGSWIVGPNDGTGPSLQMGGDGSVSYSNPTVDPYYCPGQYGDVVEAPTDSSGGSESAAVQPAPDTLPAPAECVQRDVGPSPQGDEAITRAKDVLTLLGIDPAAFEFEASPTDPGSPSYAYVTAYQVIEGQRTGMSGQVSFSGPELSSVWGPLAPVVAGAEYPIISAAQAVARLGDPRFGTTNVFYPMDYSKPEGPAYVPPTDVVVSPTPAAGAPISWPVTEVTITGAELGLTTQYQPDGSILILPAYTLSDGSGVTWSVIAVADSAFDFSATG